LVVVVRNPSKLSLRKRKRYIRRLRWHARRIFERFAKSRRALEPDTFCSVSWDGKKHYKWPFPGYGFDAFDRFHLLVANLPDSGAETSAASETSDAPAV
jgi:hypothetical protein